jgi:hypothetical protein
MQYDRGQSEDEPEEEPTMEISFFRDAPIDREVRTLSAATYNLTRLLLARSREGCIFVPIRTMQYLAVIDAEEIIFTHREAAREVEIAWTRFLAGERSALDQPVAFEALYYHPQARSTMKRLPVEFHQALELMEARQAPAETARVLDFPNRHRR